MSLAEVEGILGEVVDALENEADLVWFAPSRENIVRATQSLKDAHGRVRRHAANRCVHCGKLAAIRISPANKQAQKKLAA